MQFRFFTIAVHGGDSAFEELNRFLSSHRILAIDRSLVQDGANSAWAICVSFEPSDGQGQSGKSRSKIDYREVLNDQDFALFAKLRSLRKEMAEAEGVPAYALFTNDQLAEMVQRRVQTKAAMQGIPGIGDARMEKYGEAFLRILRQTSQPATAGGVAHET
ncbi:MAG: HRDC domain-containing protein [Magnetococcales bacterium]|nr:HRDC domain-containing protein [Magnetococcales bacterium]